MSEYDSIDDQELHEIIGEASRRKQVAEDELSVDEVKEVADELDIQPEFVDKAINELERRREASKKARELAQAKRQKLLRVGGIAGGVMVVIALSFVGITYSSLQSTLSAAEQKRAQVENVAERQVKTEQMYAGQADSMEKNAALEGAENRVRIEIRRYDEIAADYNSSAAGITGSLVVSATGLPAELPLSDDIEQW